MKTRSGFVSNSSSSSFVILGIGCDEKEATKLAKSLGMQDDDVFYEFFEKLRGIECLYTENNFGDYSIGKCYVNTSCDEMYLEPLQVTFETLKKDAEFVASTLKVNPSRVTLMLGTRSS